jgi:hypothetical protein
MLNGTLFVLVGPQVRSAVQICLLTRWPKPRATRY